MQASLGTLIATWMLLAVPLSAHAVTFNVLFTDGAENPTGTITYAAVNDPEPVAYTFLRDTVTFTEAGFQGFSFATVWSLGQPVSLGGVAVTAGDDAFTLISMSGNNWSLNTLDSGTFSFSPVPEPASATLMGLGVLGLGLRKRWSAPNTKSRA